MQELAIEVSLKRGPKGANDLVEAQASYHDLYSTLYRGSNYQCADRVPTEVAKRLADWCKSIGAHERSALTADTALQILPHSEMSTRAALVQHVMTVARAGSSVINAPHLLEHARFFQARERLAALARTVALLDQRALPQAAFLLSEFRDGVGENEAGTVLLFSDEPALAARLLGWEAAVEAAIALGPYVRVASLARLCLPPQSRPNQRLQSVF